jgi:hypothetical protein
MAGWRDQINILKTKVNIKAALETPNAVDEFAAADSLDNDAIVDINGRGLMSDALEDLRSRHLAFRRAEKCEECDLDNLRLEILTAVTESPALQDYYNEAWQVRERDPGSEPAPVTPSSSWRRIAVMQVELMVRAFSTLQLSRFGNAPENHGWMAMFRSWASSPRFNRLFAELRPTLPPEFVRFYRLYLQDLPPFASVYGYLPVHHPWLLPSDPDQRRRFRGRGFYMDSGIVEGEIDVEVRPGSGGVVDPRGPDRADQTFEKPSDSSDDGGTKPG